MKYTGQEQLNEILLRGERLRRRKERNTIRALSASAVMLFVALVVCICAPGASGIVAPGTDYGSFLLSAETGGYVLVAVLAFAAGVITTVVIHKRRKAGREPE